MRNIYSKGYCRSSYDHIFRESNVRNGEENLNFCYLVLDIVLDWEMFGAFLIYVINTVVAHFSFLILFFF